MSPLDPAQWQRASAILDQLLELAVELQGPRLVELCDDPLVRAEVESLLAQRPLDGFLEEPAAIEGALERLVSLGDRAPERAGPFRLREAIGRGGMGVVYRAVREDGGFAQTVALKLIKRGLDSEQVVERFRRERQILAALDHPGIARLIDGGMTSDGRPYFAMELVEGAPVTTWCDDRRLDLEARVRLFVDVCRSVQHAHQALVVHRDLKPSNVLVDRSGQVKLLDFGIAKLLADEAEASRVTEPAGLAFTPEVAAPEQLANEAVSTATDVYGLGMVLYELVAGSRPPRPSGATPLELASWLREREPPRPSAALAAHGDAARVAELRSTGLERLRRVLRGDLELILGKALQPLAEKRYRTAEAMADDLERYLEGMPVRARPASIGYRIGRFAGRHRLGLAAGAIALASLLVGLGGALWQGRVARQEATTARAVIDLLIETFRGGDPASGGATDITARELLARGIEGLEAELAGEPRIRAELRTVLADIAINLGDAQLGHDLARLALADWRDTRADGRSRARILRVLGTAQSELGDSATAEATLREALQLYGRVRPRMPEEEAEALDRLAIVLHSLNRPQEALTLVEEALELREALSPDSAAVTDSMNNLAVLRREAGDLDGAIQLHREVLTRRRRLLDADHPDITESLNNLGAALFHLGRLEEAATLYEEALVRSRKSWGETHPQVARAGNNLAVTLRELGQLDRSEELFAQVQRVWEELGGAESPNAVITGFNLARIAGVRGELGEAMRILDRVIASWEASLGPAHPNLAFALLQRAGVERQQGELEAAARDLDRASEILSDAVTAPHQYLASAMAEAGELAAAHGDHSAALVRHREALEMRRRLYGDRHPATLSSSAAVAVELAELGSAGATDELRAALEAAQEVLVPPSPILARIQLRVGEALCELGAGDQALTALRAATTGLSAAIGARRWPVWESRAIEIECLETLDRIGEAAALVAAIGPTPADLPAPLARRWRSRLD